MEKRKIGTTDIEVTPVGLGGWPMGPDYWGKCDDADSIRTIHKALDIGINFIDTAPAYSHGHSEEFVFNSLSAYTVANVAVLCYNVFGGES